MGRVRGLLQARSLRARHRLSVRRRHRRAAAAGPAAGSRPRSLGDRRGRTQIAAEVDGGLRRRTSETVRAFFQDLRIRGLRGIRCSWSAGRGVRDHPGDRGMLPPIGAPALPRTPDAQSRGQGLGGSMAGIQGSGHSLLSRRPRGYAPDCAPTGDWLHPRRLRQRPMPSALACFEDDFESCIAHLRPPGHAPPASFAPPISSNGYSSRNGDGLKIIPNGFGEKPVLKLMFGALIRAAERWR